jgi:hypothetical protein
MATQVQWRRGTTPQVAAFVGAIGEIVVDTTLNQMSVQDGITPGGWYAAKSSGGSFSNTTLTGTTTISGTINALSTAWTLTGSTISGGTFSGSTLTGPTISTATIVASTLASPTLTGTPVAPSAAVNTNTTQIATTAFVLNQLTSSTSINLAMAAAMGVSL